MLGDPLDSSSEELDPLGSTESERLADFERVLMAGDILHQPRVSRGSTAIRLKVLVNLPLPNCRFIAPYNPQNRTALEELQCFIYNYLEPRAYSQTQKDLMNNISPEMIRLEMDHFEIPFDEPDILRDGDIIEARIPTDLESDILERCRMERGENPYSDIDDDDDKDDDEDDGSGDGGDDKMRTDHPSSTDSDQGKDDQQDKSTAGKGQGKDRAKDECGGPRRSPRKSAQGHSEGPRRSPRKSTQDEEEKVDQILQLEQVEQAPCDCENDGETTDTESGADDSVMELATKEGPEDRAALLEADRIAALLKAGALHDMAEHDVESSFEALPTFDSDIPAMPGSVTRAKAPANAISSAPMSFPFKAIGGGASAALTAFEARKKAMAGSKVAHIHTSSAPIASDRPSSNSPSDTSDSKIDSSSSSDDSTSSDEASSSDSDDATSNSSNDSSGSSGTDLDASADPAQSSASSEVPKGDGETRQDKSATISEEGVAAKHKPVPPGQGTMRTRKRNVLRRKKLQLAREAERQIGLAEAKERVEGREKGEAVDQNVSAEEIQQSASGTSPDVGETGWEKKNATHINNRSGDIEQTAQSASVVNNKKRKHSEISDEITSLANSSQAQDATNKDLPTAGHIVPPSERDPETIPACITVHKINCEDYYEAEVTRLQQADHSAANATQSEPNTPHASGITSNDGLSSAQRMAIQEQAEEQDGLDYGEPEDTSASVPRKRVRVEADATIDGSDSGFVVDDIAGITLAQLWVDVDCGDAMPILECSLRSPRLKKLVPGAVVVFEELALHPARKCPEMMRFVGVIYESSKDQLELEVKGPISETDDYVHGLENQDRIWSRNSLPEKIGFLF